MQRPYIHLDRITKAHQNPRAAGPAARKKKATGFLDLPMEVRLDIYRELRQPRFLDFIFDDESGDLPPDRWPFGFPLALLLVNKKINAEAKLIFYGENTYVIFIDSADRRYRFRTVARDRPRRHAMLPFVKAAHLHFKTYGDLILPEGNGTYAVEGIEDAVAVLCKDFAGAPALKSLKISFQDVLHRNGWVPDDAVYTAAVDDVDMDDMNYDLWDALGDLTALPNHISVELGQVLVFDITDTYGGEDGDRQEDLEEKFRSSFNEMMASRPQSEQALQQAGNAATAALLQE